MTNDKSGSYIVFYCIILVFILFSFPYLYGRYTANCHTYYYLLFHHPLTLSFQAWNIPFLQILPTAAFHFFFRADYMDFPDCLLLLLIISVSYFLVFLFLHFLIVGSVQ